MSTASTTVACRSACDGALTTRKEANASPLAKAIEDQGGECMIVELDLVSQESISAAFATIRREADDPD